MAAMAQSSSLQLDFGGTDRRGTWHARQDLQVHRWAALAGLRRDIHEADWAGGPRFMRGFPVEPMEDVWACLGHVLVGFLCWEGVSFLFAQQSISVCACLCLFESLKFEGLELYKSTAWLVGEDMVASGNGWLRLGGFHHGIMDMVCMACEIECEAGCRRVEVEEVARRG